MCLQVQKFPIHEWLIRFDKGAPGSELVHGADKQAGQGAKKSKRLP